MLKMRCVVTSLLLTAASAGLSAQDSTHVEFDAVSIKRHEGADLNMNMRSSPDGTMTFTNASVATVLAFASPVPMRDVIGLPDWASTERYDIIAKAPTGARRDQQRPMMRAMLTERLKLVAHMEQRQRDAFALMLRRADGRLGPQLTPSTLNCGSAPPPFSSAQGRPLTVEDFQKRCGIGGVGPTMASGSITVDQLARFLSGPAGGEVEDHTGLMGRYAFTLTFSRQRLAVSPTDSTPTDDIPDLFTAVQEQLGLKLQHEKKMGAVYVIEHIERPTEN